MNSQKGVRCGLNNPGTVKFCQRCCQPFVRESDQGARTTGPVNQTGIGNQASVSKPVLEVQKRAADQAPDGLWRDGKTLVVHKGASLPDRCIKCNEPAEGLSLNRKLVWHQPWLYLLIIPSIWIYAVVALIVRQK